MSAPAELWVGAEVRRRDRANDITGRVTHLPPGMVTVQWGRNPRGFTYSRRDVELVGPPPIDFTVARAGVRLDLKLTDAPATALPTTDDNDKTVTVDPDAMVVHVVNGDVTSVYLLGYVVGLHNVIQGSDWWLTGPSQVRPPEWTHPILRQLADDNQWRLRIPE